MKNHIIDIFDSIESAGDTLFSLICIKRDYTKEVFIDNFFNNMFIWGSNLNESVLHSTKNIKKMFENIMKLFEEFWNSQEILSYKELNLLKDIENIYKYFIQIQNNLKYVGLNTKDGFIKLINEDSNDNNNDYEKYLKQYNLGNLVPIHCGHNGALNTEEAALLERYLTKSSFLNDKNGENIEEDNDDINNCPVESNKNINNII